MKQNQRILNMAILAMLLALVVVLQYFGGFVKIGPFAPSLVLIPIVIGAIVVGPKGGAILGAAFGIVVIFQCFTGMDAGGFMLWGINPFFTSLICLVKGICAGLVPGYVYKLIVKDGASERRAVVGSVLAALTAPVVNTGLFLIGLSTLFTDTLYAWSGETNVMLYIFTGLIGLNFIIEFAINAVVSPAISTVVRVATKKIINEK